MFHFAAPRAVCLGDLIEKLFKNDVVSSLWYGWACAVIVCLYCNVFLFHCLILVLPPLEMILNVDSVKVHINIRICTFPPHAFILFAVIVLLLCRIGKGVSRPKPLDRRLRPLRYDSPFSLGCCFGCLLFALNRHHLTPAQCVGYFCACPGLVSYLPVVWLDAELRCCVQVYMCWDIPGSAQLVSVGVLHFEVQTVISVCDRVILSCLSSVEVLIPTILPGPHNVNRRLLAPVPLPRMILAVPKRREKSTRKTRATRSKSFLPL